MSDKPEKTRDEIQAELDEGVPTKPRRVLMISPSEFAGLFTKGLVFAKKTRIAEGIPEDAKLLGVAYDLRLDAIVMVVESAEYDEVPMTELPPRQLISIEQGVAKAVERKNGYKKK